MFLKQFIANKPVMRGPALCGLSCCCISLWLSLVFPVTLCVCLIVPPSPQCVCVANSAISPVIAAGQTQRQQKPSVPPLLSITFQITGRSS